MDFSDFNLVDFKAISQHVPDLMHEVAYSLDVDSFIYF